MDHRWTPLPLDDPRIAEGMRAQMNAWRQRLADGDRRWGWKVAFNAEPIQRRLGLPGCALGGLTTQRLIASGSDYSIGGMTAALVEPEIAITVGSDVGADADVEQATQAISCLRPALEIIDLDQPFEDLQALLAANIFHRAVVVGEPAQPQLPWAELCTAFACEGKNEITLRPRQVLGEPGDIVRFVAGTLAACGESLQAGDTILSGSMCAPAALRVGSKISLDAGAGGNVSVSISA